MQNTKYIQVLDNGEYKELPEAEVATAKEQSTSHTVIRVHEEEVFSDNPGASRKLDAFTPHVSARRFLQDLFPSLSYEATCALAVFLTKARGSLVILQ